MPLHSTLKLDFNFKPHFRFLALQPASNPCPVLCNSTAKNNPVVLYRLCETFQTVSQLPLASPTFTHRLDPHWPLCVYDIRGSCRDAKCEFQHASDYQLENVAVLRDLHNQAVRSVSCAVACFAGGAASPATLRSNTLRQAECTNSKLSAGKDVDSDSIHGTGCNVVCYSRNIVADFHSKDSMQSIL